MTKTVSLATRQSLLKKVKKWRSIEKVGFSIEKGRFSIDFRLAFN